MAIEIIFYNETDEDVEVYESVIRDIVREAARFEGLDESVSCNFIFVDNNRIRAINEQYRGKNDVTDVITFEAEVDEILGVSGSLGDVFISIDRMIEQSYEYGHGEVREMSFLAVHGFLHLLGYDHLDEKQEKIMFARQEAILNAKDIRR
ncbi:MAG: rRNA maturation RNase YbeY [Turicibacter sp.]|nr:rRNA maturation RNase YbeY [Turicibacter sp.]